MPNIQPGLPSAALPKGLARGPRGLLSVEPTFSCPLNQAAALLKDFLRDPAVAPEAAEVAAVPATLGMTLLHQACATGAADCAAALLRSGRLPGDPARWCFDAKGRTPRHVALRFGRSSCVAVGASKHPSPEPPPATALHHAPLPPRRPRHRAPPPPRPTATAPTPPPRRSRHRADPPHPRHPQCFVFRALAPHSPGALHFAPLPPRTMPQAMDEHSHEVAVAERKALKRRKARAGGTSEGGAVGGGAAEKGAAAGGARSDGWWGCWHALHSFERSEGLAALGELTAGLDSVDDAVRGEPHAARKAPRTSLGSPWGVPCGE